MSSSGTPKADLWAQRIAHQLRDLGMTGGGQTEDGTLLGEPVLFISQKTNLFKPKVEFLVYNRNGQQIGVVSQVPRSETRIQLMDMQGTPYLELVRRGTGRKADVLVTSHEGSPLGLLARHRGTVEKAIGDSRIGKVVRGVGEVAGTAGDLATMAVWSIPVVGTYLGTTIGLGAAAGDAVLEGLKGQVRFHIDDAGANRIGVLVAEGDPPTDMAILDINGATIARIRKVPRPSGWKQSPNGANYAVEFPRLLDEPFRSLAVASAVAIGPVTQHLGT